MCLASLAAQLDGFVSFSLLRRDGLAKVHGSKAGDASDEPTYMSCTVWQDREAFQGWRDGQAFKGAHGAGEKKGSRKEETKKPPRPLWSRPPVPVFYEGVLVISDEDGA